MDRGQQQQQEEVVVVNGEDRAQGNDNNAGIGDDSHNEDDNNADSENARKYRAPGDLDKILSQFDPDRMKLTAEEHARAEDIKDMVEMMPDLDNLTDFWYAQLAIICKGRNYVDDAIQRCYGLQEFKQEYKILDTPEQGFRYLQKNFEVFPQEPLAFSFSEKDGTYVFIHDVSKFDPKAFTSPEMAEDWLIAMYYYHTLYNPDLEAVRKGIIVLVECEGMTMKRDALKHFQNFFSQLLTYYPFNGQCRHYHTGTMMNVFSSILRAILPSELRDTYQVGLQFDGNMGDTFLTPTVEQANKRVLGRLHAALKLRYEQEASFAL